MAKRIHDREYNKGEWAELYVFLHLLGTGVLYAADSDLDRKADSFLEVAKVVRRAPDGKGMMEYIVHPGAETVEVRRGDSATDAVVEGMSTAAADAFSGSTDDALRMDSLFSSETSFVDGCFVSGPEELEVVPFGIAHSDDSRGDVFRSEESRSLFVPMGECCHAAHVLFDYLVSHEKGAKTMHAPVEVCDFAEKIGVENPKAQSVAGRRDAFGGKADIVIETRDGRNGMTNRMGFSIKSQFGSAATLFNAGPSAPLLYWVAHCDDALMREFNALRDMRGNRGWFACCQPFLSEHGLRVSFARARNAGSFERNLLFVREGMLEIIAACVYERFIGGAAASDVAEIVDLVAERNPMRYPPAIASAVYEKAMKDFLYAAFSGMSMTKPWNGVEQVNGGYIVVKPDGDVLCYHANDREEFREYLFRATAFEYVSAKKYGWSIIEKCDGEYLLPVNFSIRFKR
ncbi:MAG: HpaII family restriction endonuclease [Slackia sp.]|nr:HpaII family restriction endonuclease [Slackia sp.]